MVGDFLAWDLGHATNFGNRKTRALLALSTKVAYKSPFVNVPCGACDRKSQTATSRRGMPD